MYTILFVSLLGLVASIPLASRNADRAAQYLLPTTTFPTLYDVRLYINPNDDTGFSGNVSIRILANVETSEIVIHALELSINSIRVVPANNENEDLFSNFTVTTDDTQLLYINLNRELTVLEPYVIHISYDGLYAANMFGLYVSTYTENNSNVNVVTSQLQPTYARRVFPCYDEPALKAVFRTTIYAPQEFAVIRSNTLERDDVTQPEVAGYVKHEFEDTLVMSTYLNAYLISNFEYIDNTANPIYGLPFRVYSRPGTKEFAEFALDFGQKNMVALENYTEVPYAFPKMDHTAVPDFAAGAMENWGLVIYREAALLVQDGVTTTSLKQGVATIICHENMHMWFGNEVSPQSWSYTWLNEGFADFFQSFATGLVLPEWRMMHQYVIRLQNVMQSDAVLSVNPMTNDVFTPSEILGNFNSVAYSKSGSVIRMMQHFLTPEVFRKGLSYYIQDNARSAATPTILYAALNKALAESNHSLPYPLAAIMNLYTTQGGFPVLTITRSAPEADSVVIRQERYLTDRSQTANTRYYAPLNWVISTDVNFEDTKPQDWLAPTTVNANAFIIPGLKDAEWYIFNKQQTGYYRINYDVRNWQALARVLSENHEIIHVLNRAQLIDDSFNLARNGRLSYQYAFELSNYLRNEIDYIPWASANSALTYLDTVLRGSAVYENFKTYALELTNHLYNELGFNVIQGEEFVTPYLRNIILDINCKYGNEDCVQNAQTLLEEYRDNTITSLNPDIQTTVYCSGLRGGDEGNFNFLWNRFQTTTDSSEESILLSALGCTSNEELVDFYLNQVLDENSPVRQQNKHSIIVSVINSGQENMEKALDFLLENFDVVQNNVQQISGTTNILNTLGSSITTAAHLAKINEFEAKYEAIFSAGERASIAAMKENVAAVISWNTENVAVVDQWLNDNFGNEYNNANTIVISSFLFISLIVTMFNM